VLEWKGGKEIRQNAGSVRNQEVLRSPVTEERNEKVRNNRQKRQRNGMSDESLSLSLGITAVWTQTPPAQRPYGASCHRNPENRHARQVREQQT
jgi:hypothetical protein